MTLTLRPLDAATASAVRLGVAVAASLALHATAAFVLAGMPFGSPTGKGTLVSHPLHARIVAPSPEPERITAVMPRQSNAPPTPKRPAPVRERAAAPVEAAQPLGLRESPVYYPAAQLDVRPRLTTRVDPVYPRIAPPDGGYVVLRLLIGEDGWVERTLVVLADPEGYFEDAAADAFAGARFAPGRRGGIAVKSQLWVELKFHPLGTPDPPLPEPEQAAR
jgi:protein TonB